MDNSAVTGQKPKNTIAVHARRVSIILLVLVLLLMTAVAAVVIRGITKDADVNPNHSLSNLVDSLPVVVVMLAAFLLYVAVRDALMKRILFTPLNRLAQSVLKGKFDNAGILDRNDEIGDLARTVLHASEARQHQAQLLNAVNSAAVVLLAKGDETDFEVSLLKGMEIIGRCVEVDRIHIWRNETIDGVFCYVKQAGWLSEVGEQSKPAAARRAYSENSEWEKCFLRKENINGPVSSRTQQEQDILIPQGVKSVLAIPLYMRGEFYGFLSFDDERRERFFTSDEVDILRVAGLMMISAMSRNEQAIQVSKAQEHTQILLDAMPLSTHLWSRDRKMFDCNEESVNLFRAKDKQDFVDRFFEFSPEYQPDGQLSSQKAFALVSKAFDEGRLVFEWMHMLDNGTMLPTEVTLVRVALGDDYVVASYARDLRKDKQMMAAITRRDSLLNTVNSVASVLIQSEIDEFDNNLQRCMGMMGEAVSADRVCIWKNHLKDNELYCTQVYEWLDGAPRQLGTEKAIDLSYKTSLPSWVETLSQGNCINDLIRNMPPVEQAELGGRGILSIFVVPVYVHGSFWGFVGFDDFHHERVFTENEELILRSGSIMIANALLRNDMAQSIRDSAAKLEAVIANYPGLIWCVDTGNVITLFNGRYLNRLGIEAGSLEGRKLDEALPEDRFGGIRESVQKTFAGEPQDTNSEIDGRIYRIRTTSICDAQGRIINVVGSFDDITERTRLQKELKAAMEAAQAANTAKSSFLANMSHEMRTPLNAVIGFSELTLDAGGLSEEVAANLEKIYNAGATLLSTVNDILDISKIEAGKLELVPVDYDIPSLINDAITQSIMRIGEKPIHFSLDIEPDLPLHLNGDDLRIKQLLNNLLSNAFKYTREGTVELRIRCEREPSSDTVWMTINVSDTGKGIPQENMKDLFSDYTQADLRSNRAIEGTGLGLPITKRIAEMMGGSISAESEYGKGSTFTVRIRQKYISDAVIGEDVVKNLKELRYSENKRDQNSRLNRVRLPYARVLVVDDVETNLDVARGMMKPYGMQIDCINNGPDAINAVRAEKVRYDAIFMDHMMPEMDGIEATRIIREEIGTEYARTVPIVALTANAIVGNAEMFLGKGFQAFLPKPIEVAKLDAVVQKWVRDKEKEKDLADRFVEVEGEKVLDVRSGNDRRQSSNRRTVLDSLIFDRAINGLDADKGLERFGGDRETYIEILSSYAINTKPLLRQIQGVSRDTLPSYAITVHGMKGSSRSICAESVGNQAEALEKAAKAGDFDFVVANNPAFIAAVDKLVADLNDLLEKNAPESPKPTKDRPDRDALDRLRAACEAFDMDGVEQTMAEINAHGYRSDDGLVAWLTENANLLNFAEIAERLARQN